MSVTPEPLFPKIKHMKYKALSCENMMLIKDEKSFTIKSPEVYQIEDSNVYLVGGILQGGLRLDEMMKQFKEQGIETPELNEPTINNVEEDSEEDLEKSKLEKNIKLLMNKGNISREAARELLERHDGDLFKALVDLSE
ncbi:Nascent polypeptide-associated complex subunit alpha-like protein [Cucumispora dikerogammari]|nr:Nascent polypeptide-associated complex subunit alpha-like protein [Cucumispora dikerogammari]